MDSSGQRRNQCPGVFRSDKGARQPIRDPGPAGKRVQEPYFLLLESIGLIGPSSSLCFNEVAN